jgi:hypothetical protein
MRARRTVITLLLVAVAGLLWYFRAAGTTPAGQPPLTRVTPGNFSELTSAFNAAVGAPRIIVLLSPT